MTWERFTEKVEEYLEIQLSCSQGGSEGIVLLTDGGPLAEA